MKISSKLLKASIASLAVAAGLYATPAFAELRDVGPTSPETGNFPQWYKDTNGLKLDLCLAGSIDRPEPPNYCLTEPPIKTDPPSPSVHETDPTQSNFPDEAFWWAADAVITVTNAGRNNGRATLVLATEAAFANEEVIDGDQMVFNRTRIRAQGLGMVAGKKYRVIYPYGSLDLTATQKDRRKPVEITYNQDFGCVVTATTECNFRDVTAATSNRGRTKNLVGGPWLTWDDSLPAAPTGYIGDPNVEHKITGSPTGNNYFKIVDIASGTTIAETNLFSVSGKLSTP